jgi:hypothetical protein
VDREMIEALAPDVSGIVEIVPTSAARNAGLKDMVFDKAEAVAASALPNAASHREIAKALSSVVGPIKAGRVSWDAGRPIRRVSRSQHAG